MLHLYPNTKTGKPVVFLHGLGATGASFDELVNELNGKIRPYVFDLHGFGASSDFSKTKLGASNDIMNLHVEAVLGALSDIKEPIAIVGHSMGGRIGLLLHERLSSEKISRAGPLILIAPAIKEAKLKPLISIGIGNIEGSNKPEDKAMRMLKAVRHVSPTNEDAKKYAINFKPGRTGLDTNGPALGVELTGYKTKISSIDTLLLFVWGEKDPILPIAQGNELKSLNGKAEIKKIAECGHIPHEEAPKEALPPIVKMLTDWAK